MIQRFEKGKITSVFWSAIKPDGSKTNGQNLCGTALGLDLLLEMHKCRCFPNIKHKKQTLNALSAAAYISIDEKA